MFFKDVEQFERMTGVGNHIEIVLFCAPGKSGLPGHFVTHVDDPLFFGILRGMTQSAPTATSSRRHGGGGGARTGAASHHHHKKAYREIVHRTAVLETNDQHQSRTYRKDLRGVHEAGMGFGFYDESPSSSSLPSVALVVAYDRQRLSFAGFPATRHPHSDCFVNAVVLPITGRMSLHFETRAPLVSACGGGDGTTANHGTKNKVFVSLNHDTRSVDAAHTMKEANALLERVFSVAATLSFRRDKPTSIALPPRT